MATICAAASARNCDHSAMRHGPSHCVPIEAKCTTRRESVSRPRCQKMLSASAGARPERLARSMCRAAGNAPMGTGRRSTGVAMPRACPRKDVCASFDTDMPKFGAGARMRDAHRPCPTTSTACGTVFAKVAAPAPANSAISSQQVGESHESASTTARQRKRGLEHDFHRFGERRLR